MSIQKPYFVSQSYFSKKITLDNVNYIAEINNVDFSSYNNKKTGCFTKNNVFTSNLSLLFVVTPQIQENIPIRIPYYVALLNKEKKLIDIHYFIKTGSFNKYNETGRLVETEIISTKPILFKDIDKTSILVVGFMLDKYRLNLENIN